MALFFLKLIIMKNITIIFILFWNLQLYSQTNILFNNGLNTITNDIEKFDDNNYFFTTLNYRSTINHINSEGELLNEYILQAENTYIETASYQCIKIINDNIYIYCQETE